MSLKKIFWSCNVYIDTYYIYDDENRKYVGIIQDHCRGIPNRYFVAFKYEGNEFIPNVYQPCKQKLFDTYEEALEYVQEDYSI